MHHMISFASPAERSEAEFLVVTLIQHRNSLQPGEKVDFRALVITEAYTNQNPGVCRFQI